MAKLRGAFQFRGKLGDVIANKNGVLRPASEGGKERFESSPTMARTRENAAEFAQAAFSGKLIRQALNKPLRGNRDSRLVSRLMGRLRELINQDAAHPRGQRRLTKVNIDKLVGFNFNQAAPLDQQLAAGYAVTVTTAGVVKLTMPTLVPLMDLPELTGPTHYELELGVVVLDFEQGIKRIIPVAGVPAPALIDATPVTNLVLTADMKAPLGANEILLVVLGVNYLESVNGVLYPLRNGSHNPLAVVFAQ